MPHAFARRLTEFVASKNGAYSFVAVAIAIVLHLKFGVSPENALLLVSPLGVAPAVEAHVNAKRVAAALVHSPATLAPPPRDSPMTPVQGSSTSDNSSR